MSRTCPSCGSTVATGDAACPVCGEVLDPREQGAPAGEELSVAPPAAATTASAAPPPNRADSAPVAPPTICPECGAQNPVGATECGVCGEPLRAAPPAPARSAASGVQGKPSSLVYLGVAIVGLLLTAAIFLLFRKEEVTGPPQPHAGAADTAGALPQGHPPIGGAGGEAAHGTPEQHRQLDSLKALVAASPKDDSLKMKLADLSYEASHYADAIPLYRELIAKGGTSALRIKLATAIAAMGDTDGAIAELSKLLAEEPKNQDAALNMSVMYVTKRNLDSVDIWLKKVVAIDSTSEQGRQAAMIIGQIAEMKKQRADSSGTRGM